MNPFDGLPKQQMLDIARCMILDEEKDNFNAFLRRMIAEHNVEQSSCCPYHYTVDLFKKKGWKVIAEIEEFRRDDGEICKTLGRPMFNIIAFLWDRAGYEVPSISDCIVSHCLLSDGKNPLQEPFKFSMSRITQLASLFLTESEQQSLICNVVAMAMLHQAKVELALRDMEKHHA